MGFKLYLLSLLFFIVPLKHDFGKRTTYSGLQSLTFLAGETNIKVFKNDATCGIPADRQTIKDNFNSI